MADATERPNMKTSELAQHLMRFRDDHMNGDSLELQWLGHKADDLLVLLCDIDEGTYSPETMAELKEFEAGLIQCEIDAKQRELANLEQKMKKARAA